MVLGFGLESLVSGSRGSRIGVNEGGNDGGSGGCGGGCGGGGLDSGCRCLTDVADGGLDAVERFFGDGKVGCRLSNCRLRRNRLSGLSGLRT